MGKKRSWHMNRRKNWVCPYFGWDGPEFLRCEAGRPAFPTREAANEYMTSHCADINGWKECSLAKAWNEYLEGKHESK